MISTNTTCLSLSGDKSIVTPIKQQLWLYPSDSHLRIAFPIFCYSSLFCMTFGGFSHFGPTCLVNLDKRDMNHVVSWTNRLAASALFQEETNSNSLICSVRISCNTIDFHELAPLAPSRSSHQSFASVRSQGSTPSNLLNHHIQICILARSGTSALETW